MKIACLALLLTCGAAIHGPIFATEAMPAPQSSNNAVKAAVESNAQNAGLTGHATMPGKISNEHRGQTHPSGHPNLTKANRPKQLSQNPRDRKAGAAMNVHQASVTGLSGAVNQPEAPNEFHNPARPVRPLNIVPPARPSPNNARHRGVNPASIGGASNRTTGNASAINGTRVSRRP
jgi:hypothetical protein